MTIEELAEKLGIELNDTTKGSITAYVAAQTAGLKQNNRDLLAKNADLKAKIKPFEGIDADELAELVAELEIEPADIVDRVRNAPKAAGDAAKAAEAAAEAKFQRKLAAADKKAADAEARANAADKARIDDDLTRALTEELAKKKGNVDLLLPMLRGRVRGEIDPDTGKVIRKALAANGDELLSDAGAPGTIGDLVESLRRDEKFGIAFEGEGGGSGSGTGGARKSGGPAKNPFKKGDGFNITEQVKLKQTNRALYDQLKREAQAS